MTMNLVLQQARHEYIIEIRRQRQQRQQQRLAYI